MNPHPDYFEMMRALNDEQDVKDEFGIGREEDDLAQAHNFYYRENGE